MVRPRATVVWLAGVAAARTVLTSGMRTRCGSGHTTLSRSGLRDPTKGSQGVSPLHASQELAVNTRPTIP